MHNTTRKKNQFVREIDEEGGGRATVSDFVHLTRTFDGDPVCGNRAMDIVKLDKSGVTDPDIKRDLERSYNETVKAKWSMHVWSSE